MSNQYQILKDKHQEEFNKFPIAFAFSNEQFEEGMESLGLTVDDTDKVYSVGGGGFIRKTDSVALREMRSRHQKELEEAIAGDETGEGFILDMFKYELANHEYGYTMEVEQTLDALDLSFEDIENDERLKRGLSMAKKLVV